MPTGTVTYGTGTYGEGSPYSAPTTFPTLMVEAAFMSAPFASAPLWSDISGYLRSGRVSRGRSTQLEHVSAGSCQLTLDNRPHPTTGRPFDPLNTLGPFYGYLTPNRRIRVRAQLGFAVYPIFDGYIEDYVQEYEFGDREARCVIPATDAFAMFAALELAADSRPIENAGARINAVLSNSRVGWTGGRVIDTGRSRLLAEELEGLKALEALHEADSTEQGRLFVSAGGDVTFLDRNTLVTNATYTTDQVVFGDNLTGTELPYADISFARPRDAVRNTVTVTNERWGEFRAEDATSRAAYGTRTHDVTVIDAAPRASQQTADNLLRLFKDPQSKVESIVVKPRRTTAAYPDGFFAQVLPIELGWRVGAKRRGSAYTVDQHYSVERIEHQFAPKRWETTFGFGLPQSAEAYFIWGTSLWGSTTRWAW